MRRPSRLKAYHRYLSRAAAPRANAKMRTYFAPKPLGWNPFVGWWERGIGLRLRGDQAIVLGPQAHDPAITEMAVEAVVDEIMDDPAPFVRAILEDQLMGGNFHGDDNGRRR